MINSMLTLMILCFSSCGVMSSKDALTGAVTSTALAGTAVAVKEAFTPDYPLYVDPFEICSVSGENVDCTLYPCEKNCNVVTPADEWKLENPYVATIRSNKFSAIVSYCRENQGACVELLGSYEGTKIVIQKTK